MNTKLAVNTELRILSSSTFFVKMHRVQTGCKTSLGRFPESFELGKKKKKFHIIFRCSDVSQCIVASGQVAPFIQKAVSCPFSCEFLLGKL